MRWEIPISQHLADIILPGNPALSWVADSPVHRPMKGQRRPLLLLFLFFFKFCRILWLSTDPCQIYRWSGQLALCLHESYVLSKRRICSAGSGTPPKTSHVEYLLYSHSKYFHMFYFRKRPLFSEWFANFY